MKLREVIDSYTTLKRALGASFKDAGQLLAAFSRAMGEDTEIDWCPLGLSCKRP
jgi:hypothetical protein